MKLTPKRRAVLERLSSGPKLRAAIEGSGGRIHGDLVRKGMIRQTQHPETKDAMGYPADAYEITPAGLAALQAREGE